MGICYPDSGDSVDPEQTSLLTKRNSNQETEEKYETTEDPVMEMFNYEMKNPSIFKLDTDSNNRLLYYNEYGSKSGFPIIFFHGAGSSRMEGVFFHESALNADIRMICFDRPGSGLSTLDRDMTYESICNDAKQFIQHLNLKNGEFALGGLSQGGSYVLHCLYYLQNELKPKFAVLISPLPPFTLIDESEDADDILSGDVKMLRSLRKNHPKLYDVYSGMNGWMIKNCWCMIAGLIDKAFESESDKRILVGHKKYHLVALQYSISGEYGMEGATIQGKNSFDDWQFDIVDMDASVPILCFHGNDDTMIDLRWVKLMDKKLPQMTLNVFDGYGHLMCLDPHNQTQIMASIQTEIRS